MSNFEDVKIFMETFGQLVRTKPQFPDKKTMQLRYDLIKEELDELEEAMKTKNLKELGIETIELPTINLEEVKEMDAFRKQPYEYHRTSVYALLNNWDSDLDKARLLAKPKETKKRVFTKEML